MKSRFFTLVLVCLVGTSGVYAGTVPNFAKRVDISVREQPLDLFLDALFREIGVPVSVGEGVEGTVNGRFNNSAQDIFREVSNAFNVIVYYDGSVAHTYPANSLTQRVISMSGGKVSRLMKLANRIGLPDNRNTLKRIDSGVIASGTPRFLQQVEELEAVVAKSVTPAPVREVGVEEDYSLPVLELLPAAKKYPMTYRVFQLRYAWADDTSFSVAGQSVNVPGVASILRNLISGDAMMYGSTGRVREPNSRSLDGLRGRGLQMVNEPDSEGLIAGNQFNVNRMSSSSELSDIRIVADTRLNAIIIRDTADRMPAYAELIRSLDVASTMVEIEATIIDINADKSRELGVNWRFNGDDGGVQFGSGGRSDSSLTSSGVANPQGRGGVLSFSLGEPGEFLARVRALEESGAARVVSKPHVITLSDVEAVLGATTEFFVRVAGDEEVDLFNVPVGTQMRVTPHVFTEGGGNHIKMLVNIEDGSPSGTETVDSIPVIERSNINTQAVIREGDSLLVGGLVRDSYREFTYRVPILGRIPLLGRLFRSDRNTSTRVERLFMITPRLASGKGFGPTRSLPRLQGEYNEILSDAGVRLDNVTWPAQKERRYWPNERRMRSTDRDAAIEQAERANTRPARQQQNQANRRQTPLQQVGTGYAASQQQRVNLPVKRQRPQPVYKTHFSVEPWNNSSSSQSRSLTQNARTGSATGTTGSGWRVKDAGTGVWLSVEQ